MSATPPDDGQGDAPPQVFPIRPDERAQDARVLGTVKRWLGNGWQGKVILRKSLRVGSATALAAFDGNDGAVVASGALAALAFGDRTTPANYGLWYRDAGKLRLFSGEAGDLWQVDPATGQLAQAAWVAPTLVNNFANFGSGFQAAGYFKDTVGVVHLRGLVANNLSPGAGTTIFTLPAGSRPSQAIVLAVSATGAFGELRITAAGAVGYYSGNAAYLSLDGISFDTR